MTDPPTVLVVDDSVATVEVLTRNLEAHGLRVVAARDAEAARRCLGGGPVDLMVTDLKMPGESGIELIRTVRERHPRVAIVMITGYPSIETAVEAVKSGAEEYLPKPFTDDELLAAVDRALGEGRRRRAGTAAEVHRRHGLLAGSPAMAAVVRAVDDAARRIDPVLVLGPPGSGRTECARAVHRASDRADRPFVAVSCASGDGEWLRGQLFGNPPPERSPGLLERCSGGSLLLQEVEWLPAGLQVEVLRAIHRRSVPLPGRRRERQVDVRFMASATTDLAPRCAAGRFRRDLAVLLGSTTIVLPALDRRSGDPSLLAADLLDRLCRRDARPPVTLTEETARRLDGLSWPGQVAELERVVAAALERAPGDRIEPGHLPEELGTSRDGGTGPRSLAEVEKAHIERVLDRTGGNKSEAARLLGIDRKTLRDKLRRAGARGE